MNHWLLLAGLAAGATCAVHVLLGGREIARPMLASNDLHRIVRLTNYYCWHMVTIVLAGMAGAFAYAAWHPASIELAAVFTLLAASFAVLSLGLIAVYRVRPLLMPQWILFLAITALGVAGLAR
jgi:hypothetical protein